MGQRLVFCPLDAVGELALFGFGLPGFFDGPGAVGIIIKEIFG